MTITIRNQKLFCTCCGGEFTLIYPMSAQEMVEKTGAFEKLHKNCKQTWTEPIANPEKSEKERAVWWLANGERGMSSKTMYDYFTGEKRFDINHPYDPDDFKRCYKLLQVVPEWKSRILELGKLSKEWDNLAKNWDKLTAMYEENIRTNWKEYKRIGMYEFMESLIE